MVIMRQQVTPASPVAQQLYNLVSTNNILAYLEMQIGFEHAV